MMTGREIFETLTQAGIPEGCIHVVDAAYSLPDSAYLKDHGRRFGDFLSRNGIKGEEEAQDCDDYALLCAGLSRLDHSLHNAPLLNLPEAQETQPPQATSIAIGIVHAYIEGTPFGHAVNIAIHRESSRATVRLYEPQPLNGVCLTEIPLSSAQSWRLVYI